MTGPRTPPRHLTTATTVALAALTLAACGGADGSGDRASGRQEAPYWAEGVTFARVAELLRVTVPGTATERTAAVQRGFQDDGLLLAFVLPEAETGRFVAGLAPEQPLVRRAEAAFTAAEYRPTTPFAHLGLPEPETLDEVTTGPVCAPCGGDLNSLEVTVAPLDGDRARIYLRGVD
ncbi:hypothetical protein AB0O01_05410 [Streptomyces sp. NPDC093252]|uniref:hypothetical protein n=1 Tax=Streptomyces sp. NPDC093252 TaxID=3154980 RepID=UPI003440C820